jgi:hypothetical protein
VGAQPLVGEVMIMKLLVIGLFLLGLCGCSVNSPIEITPTNNPAIHVALLFEKDGCKVFRFDDAGHFHYFTNCTGSIGSMQGCGKNCTREELIQTSVK